MSCYSRVFYYSIVTLFQRSSNIQATSFWALTSKHNATSISVNSKIVLNAKLNRFVLRGGFFYSICVSALLNHTRYTLARYTATERSRKEKWRDQSNTFFFSSFYIRNNFYTNKTLSKKSEKLKILIKYDNKQRGQCGPSLLWLGAIFSGKALTNLVSAHSRTNGKW